MPPASYLALPVDVVNPRDLGHGETGVHAGDPDYPWHILAEGDSWFTIAAIPSSNLLFELRLGRWTQVLNLAYPGDTLRRIGDLVGNVDLLQQLAQRNFNTAWDALLLSVGGNDVIEAAPALIRRSPAAGMDPSRPESHLDEPALEALLQGIQEGCGRIAALRDSAESKSRGCPVFVHTYDYVTPRRAPARFIGLVPFRGPWLYEAFAGSGLDIVLQQQIANLLIDRLAAALLELDGANAASGKALPGLHVVDTRNTLVMANPVDVGNSNDWLNEIHPNLWGYRKIAARLSAAINEVLLG
jgi:lysophospholipase L1-like esterase